MLAMQLPTHIIDYFESHKISQTVLQKIGISYDGRIVIPVHDIDGNVLFHKYRRDPENEDGPKYMYEKGSSSSLFGIQQLNGLSLDVPIYICEGEKDAMTLMSYGLVAVSGTGGAGTFKQEWVDTLYLYNTIYICYDTDSAGINGAIKIQSLIPHAEIIYLPDKNTKDVNDFICKYSIKEFLEIKPKRYALSDLKQKEIKNTIEIYMEERRVIRQGREPTDMIDTVIEYLVKRYEESKIKKKKKVYIEQNNDRKERAKQYPMDALLQFNQDDKTACIFHQEKTPSMKWNKDNNTVHCFGCNRHADVIDVYIQLNNVSFIQALERLTAMP